MSYTGRYGCSHIDGSEKENFEQIPDACKIANGMGIAVVATAILTILLVSTRPHEHKEIETGSSTTHVDVIEINTLSNDKLSNKEENA